ncbi:unnamed protein product [Moneuplotes crassus]|uniref:Uncharacterized protein n=1 Tax=Euplotes crassus TaxID=5936 RepID=A0AAD1UAP7_EUPCR|nr:unnamed protein product [Moneuplotes crassus]
MRKMITRLTSQKSVRIQTMADKVLKGSKTSGKLFEKNTEELISFLKIVFSKVLCKDDLPLVLEEWIMELQNFREMNYLCPDDQMEDAYLKIIAFICETYKFIREIIFNDSRISFIYLYLSVIEKSFIYAVVDCIKLVAVHETSNLLFKNLISSIQELKKDNEVITDQKCVDKLESNMKIVKSEIEVSNLLQLPGSNFPSLPLKSLLSLLSPLLHLPYHIFQKREELMSNYIFRYGDDSNTYVKKRENKKEMEEDMYALMAGDDDRTNLDMSQPSYLSGDSSLI